MFPEQVRRDDHVELPGIHHELHCTGVDDAIIHFHASGVLLGDLTSRLQKDAGQSLQHVRLLHDRDLLSSLSHVVIEGKADDAQAFLPRVDPLGTGRIAAVRDTGHPAVRPE
jgi:hypothetical protein